MTMANSRNYSFDLETLGTKYNSYILSIACVEFNIETGEVLAAFKRKVVCGSKFNIDYGTVMWWLEQSDEARGKLTSKEEQTVPIQQALYDLNEFIQDGKHSKVWGNGATFDISILDYAYSVKRIVQPWKYWNVRDMRTIVDLAESVGFIKKRIKFEGVRHDSLDDAAHQAKVMANAYNYIKHGIYTTEGVFER